MSPSEDEGSLENAMAGAIHFEKSPLEEVVCGVHFAGVEWSDIHFGLFFTELAGRYQRTQRRPPLLLFDSRAQDAPQITFSTEPEATLLWYDSPDSPFLLQIQKDAFFLNWRGQSGTFVYPHFHTREGGEEGVWERFVNEWNVFAQFCTKHDIGTPEVLACHLAYVDHMVHGEAWNVPSDLAQWLRPLEGLKTLVSVSSFNMTVRYDAGQRPVRVNIRPAVRTSDKKKLFIIDFIITEKLSSEISLDVWFDEAHKTIVQEFLAQTTEDAHQEWGLSDG